MKLLTVFSFLLSLSTFSYDRCDTLMEYSRNLNQAYINANKAISTHSSGRCFYLGATSTDLKHAFGAAGIIFEFDKLDVMKEASFLGSNLESIGKACRTYSNENTNSFEKETNYFLKRLVKFYKATFSLVEESLNCIIED